MNILSPIVRSSDESPEERRSSLSAETEALIEAQAQKLGKELNAAYRAVGLAYDWRPAWEKACQPNFKKDEPMDELKKLCGELNDAREAHSKLEARKHERPLNIAEQIVLDIQIAKAWDRLMAARGAYDKAIRGQSLEIEERASELGIAAE